MTSVKTNQFSSGVPLAALALKVVGVVTILAFLIDFLILLIPPNFTDRQWQIGFVSQMVDRGIVPMVGIALLLAGYWVQSVSGRPARGSALTDLRFWALILSSILGLVFLLFTVLHPVNVNATSKQALQQIQEQATLAENQLEGRLGQELDQQRDQLDQLLQSEDSLNQALSSGRLTQEQAEQIRQFRNDPASFDEFVNQRVEQFRTQIQTEIGTRREEAVGRVRREAAKSGVRIALSSLLLAIGYIVIGWGGLRNLQANG